MKNNIGYFMPLSKNKSICFNKDKKLYKQSLSVRGEKYPLECKKIKNSSYYYYILCRRHLSFFLNSNREFEVGLFATREGGKKNLRKKTFGFFPTKKKNLLGSGKLQNKVTESNKFGEAKRILTNSDSSNSNRTSNKNNVERSNSKEVGITNFTRLLKESKKQKKEGGENSKGIFSLGIKSKGKKISEPRVEDTGALRNFLFIPSVGISKPYLNSQGPTGIGSDIFEKSLGFTHKTYIKPGKGINSGELNVGEFFPYRKSFICYWLLPFVGFVSSATLSLNKKDIKESDFYLSESFKKSDSKLLLNSNSINNSVLNRDTNDYVPEYISDELNPLINKKKNIVLNKEKIGKKFFARFEETFSLFEENPGNKILNSGGLLANGEPVKEAGGYSVRKTHDPFVTREGGTNGYFPTSEKFPSSSEFYPSGRLNFSRIIEDNSTEWNSLKFCMLYLDCLENDLKSLGEGTQNTKVNALTNSEIKSKDLIPQQNSFLIDVLTNNLNKINLEAGMDKKQPVRAAFYPTSFFNRVLLSNESFTRFFNEPLKIDLNVGENFKGIFPLGKSSKEFLPPPLSNVLEESNKSDKKDTVQSVRKFEENSNWNKIKNKDVFYENIFNKKTFITNLKLKNNDFQAGLPNNTFKLNLNNPVTSFLRASTLLDKYMVYKPILQDFSSKSDVKINIKAELVDKLFSYFSKESIKLSFPSIGNEDNLNKTEMFGHHRAQEENKDFFFHRNEEKDLRKNNISSGLRTTIIFQKLGSLDNKKIRGAPEKSFEEKGKNFPNASFEENSEFSPQFSAKLSKENKNHKKENPINISYKVNSNSNNKIYNKISKEKLYKVVLFNLKETLNSCSISSEYSKIHEKDLSDLYLDNTLNSNNQTIKNEVDVGDSYESHMSDTIRTIKFKHPILMSNKPSYPLLCSKNKMIKNFEGESNKNYERVENNQINFFPVDFKKNYPLMLQNVSPVGKDKRPIEKLNSKNNFVNNDFLETGSFLENNDKRKTTNTIKSFEGEDKKFAGKNFLCSANFENLSSVNETKKQNHLTNQYYKFKTYLNKYTGYALKDFLILNKISTYIKPISQDYSIKKSASSLKTDILPLDYEEKFLNKKVSRDSTNQNLYNNSKNLHTVFSTKNRDIEGNSKNILLHVKNPYVLNSKTKEDLIQKHDGNLDNFSLNRPNENFTLTSESPLKTRKIRENNKTAKLLRAYFSIKKSSKNKIYGVKNEIPTSSNRLKQKIYFNLNTKVGRKSKDFLQRFVKDKTSDLQPISSLNKFDVTQALNTSKMEENLIKSFKEKNQLKFLSTQFRFQKTKQGLIDNSNRLHNLKLHVSQKHEGGENSKGKKISFGNFLFIPSKKFSLSPRLLINNRLFMKINNKNGEKIEKLKKFPNPAARLGGPFEIFSPGQNQRFFPENFVSSPSETFPLKSDTSIFPNIEQDSKEFSSINEEVIRKRKSIQKKRRITKMKKETRRRKKRMRFYPRPIWLRYRVYSQFLKNRRHMEKKNIGLLPSYNEISLKRLNTILPKRYPNPIFPYTTDHSNINISSSLTGEFKTAFWKSYWLRSNLKPYLNKIKRSLNEIKETPQYTTSINSSTVQKNGVETKDVVQSHLLNNVRKFIISFLSLNNNLTNVTTNSNKILEENSSLNSRLRSQGSSSEITTSKNLSTPLHSLSKKDIESYYKTANYLAEYNEISSQRIQQFVSQIRENLTLNGNAKTRPSRISMNFGPKGLKKNGINYFKRPSLKYNAMSRLRLYWAFSKGTTNLVGLGPTGFLPGAETVNGNIYNKRKQIWTTEKYRQQIKENKTKKLLNDIKTKLQLLLNETPYISSESNIPLWNTLILKSVKKIKLQEEKLQNLVGNNQRLFPKDKISQFGPSVVEENFRGIKKPKKIFPRENFLKVPSRVLFLREKPEIFPGELKYINSFVNMKVKNPSKRPFNIHKNRLIHSYKQTAKVQPFISGKTNYWWTYGNNTPFNGMNSFLSTPIKTDNNLMSVSPSQHLSMLGREQVYGTFRQDNIFNGQIKKGWASPSFKSISDNIGMEWQLSSLQINTILFHFCSLITLLSISQIRGLLKFSFIGVNKVYSLLERLIPSYLYNSPIKSYNHPMDKSNFGFNRTNLDVLYTTSHKHSNKKDLGLNSFETTEPKNFSQGEKFSSPQEFLKNMLKDKKNRKLFTRESGDQKITLNGSDQEISSQNRQKTRGLPSQVSVDEKAFRKNNQVKFFTFDFEKQNDSFVYAFYVNRQQKDIESNSFNPRLTIETQSKVIRDSNNLFIRSNVGELNIKDRNLKSSSNEQIPPDFVPFNKFENSNILLPFFSITGIYSLLNNLVKKPFFVYYKWFNFDNTGKYLNPDKNTGGEDKFPEGNLSIFSSNRIPQMKKVAILYSLLFIRFGFRGFSELSKNTSNLLGQRTKLEGAFRSIYTFFEKPGILIVDWVAYLFLVEWASDITNTLPEKVDTQIVGSPFNKLTRTIYSLYPLLPWTEYALNQVTFKEKIPFEFFPRIVDNNLSSGVSSGLTSKLTFLGLASTFIKRRIYHLYEILLLQFYQPDTDLLVRQRKGIVFWDIWGDFLTQTAEDSNINISELTSLKEEQMKLLENASLNISESLSTKSQSTNFKQDNINDLFSRGFSPKNLTVSSKRAKQKIYSKIPSITPFKYLLSQKDENKKIQKISNNSLSSDKKENIFSSSSISSVPAREINHLKSLSMENFSSINYSTLKPITGSLGMPSKPFLGLPLQLRSQNLDGGLHQWGSQQFLSYAIKSKDTELFIDLHPPRALASVLKNKESSQQLRAISPMGSLVCQIFAGILYKQISKNVLIVGNANQRKRKNDSSPLLNESSASLEKTLLVQAIAGETELKIITDNAYRYALVYRGVAVGIKLLRDVFDSLSLQTPCFFLIEDIHAIGERRPFLLSDDTPEGGQNSEIHEKNQVLYQLSKHVISHYKKPYKGDFSLSIPTNHFCFDFFKGRNQNNSRIGKASIARQNTVSPKIHHTETSDGEQTREGGSPTPRILSSRLLRPSTELLSPPATSPFSVLTLKEEKKFKTHKKVSDLPWTGRIMNTAQGESSGSQDSQKTGPAYSVRAKVALLADMAISSLSVKLDMITDLLVIIDSVKGNRGFVVFATTHIPFVLDPALRRPGRLDETISFGFSSKSHSWEVSQFGILNVPRPSYTEPKKLLSPLSGFNTYSSIGRKGGGSLDFSLTSTGIDTNTILSRLCQKASQTYPFSTSSSKIYLKRTSSLFHFFPENLFHHSSIVKSNLSVRSNANSEKVSNYVLSPNKDNSFSTTDKQDSSQTSSNSGLFTNKSTLSHPQTIKILSQVATKASAYFNSSIKGFDTESHPRVFDTGLNSKDHKNFDLSLNNALTQLPDLSLESILSNSSYLSLYASPYFFKKHISLLISGKIGEFFLFSKKSQKISNEFFTRRRRYAEPQGPDSPPDLTPALMGGAHDPDGSPRRGDSAGSAPERTNNIFVPESTNTRILSSMPLFDSSKENSPSQYTKFVQNCNSVSTTRRSSLMPVITESISSLVLSFIQKRFLYKSNLMLPTLFNLTNSSSLLEPPSPPITSILLPARRYENLKRSLSFYQNHDQNFGSGIMEKINLHQQQRFVKRLYNIPVKESFKSEIIENRLSSFSNASLMIGSMSPSHLQKISSSNWFVRNRIFTRHSHYLTNQWWTGQLPEHNAETTFLSDIDWRYTFVEREARDILLDFPDADQHYNPRNRRWVGKTKSTFGTNIMPSFSSSNNSFYSEIYSHFIYDSFLKAFNIYEQNREVFDYYAFHVCKQGLHSHLHEFERLKLIQRFLQD